jgi:hypothetical protein
MKITHVYENKPYVKLNECEARELGWNLREFEHWFDAVSYKSSLDDKIYVVQQAEFESVFKEWTPDFSKYIPEDSVVLFLNYNDHEKYYKTLQNDLNRRIVYWEERREPSNINGVLTLYKYKKVTIVADSINSQSIQQFNNISKELKEKYNVEWVGLCSRDCFAVFNHQDKIALESEYLNEWLTEDIENLIVNVCKIDKIITTNSTGILEP